MLPYLRPSHELFLLVSCVLISWTPSQVQGQQTLSPPSVSGGVSYPDAQVQRPVYRYYAGTYYYQYGVGNYGGYGSHGGCGCGSSYAGANTIYGGNFVPGPLRNPNTRIDYYRKYQKTPGLRQPGNTVPQNKPPRTREVPKEPEGFFRKPDFSLRTREDASGIRPVSNSLTSTASPGRIRISVPTEDAKVWVEGQLMSSTGKVRKFVSPPLSQGIVYEYDIEVRWTQQGQTRNQTRSVTIRSGDLLSVNLGS